MSKRTFTLLPPDAPADVNFLHLAYDHAKQKVIVTVDACACPAEDPNHEGTVRDGGQVTFEVLPEDPDIRGLYRQAVKAWKAAKGY